MLDRGDAAGRVALAVAQPLDLVDDRNLRIAGQNEITMQRMRQPSLDGATRRHHRLSDHLAAEHPLPAGLRAVAAKHVHLDRFEIEDGNQVDQALGHGALSLISASFRGEAKPRTRNPEVKNAKFRVRAKARPGNDEGSEALFQLPVSPSYSHVASQLYDFTEQESRHGARAKHCHRRRRLRRAGAGAGLAAGPGRGNPDHRRRSRARQPSEPRPARDRHRRRLPSAVRGDRRLGRRCGQGAADPRHGDHRLRSWTTPPGRSFSPSAVMSNPASRSRTWWRTAI